jgi:hypothetical protein
MAGTKSLPDITRALIRPAEEEGAQLSSCANLAAAIRRSTLLDPALKRHWLRVLPNLAPRERERLQVILHARTTAGAAGQVRHGERG